MSWSAPYDRSIEHAIYRLGLVEEYLEISTIRGRASLKQALDQALKARAEVDAVVESLEQELEATG